MSERAETATGVDKSVDGFSLAEERRRARVKQYQVAAKLGVHPSALSMWENGGDPPGELGPRSYRAAVQAVLRERETAA